MKKYISVALLFLCLAFSSSGMALSLEERIQALEGYQLLHDNPSTHAKSADQAYSFSGFGSFTATQMTEDVTGPSGATNKLSVQPHSIMGLQFEAQLSKSTQATVQIVAEGDEDFSTELEWLYLEQQVLPYMSIKLGRFAYAIYADSDNAKISYSYPTVSLNDEVYIRSMVESIDGVSIDFYHSWDEWGGSLNIYAGEREATKRGQNSIIDLDGVYGASLIAHNNSWDLRFAWHTVEDLTTTLNDIVVPDGVFGCSKLVGCALILDMENDQFGFSAKYQQGNWYAAYEISVLRSDLNIVGDLTAQSGTFAYSVDAFQPYVQWGHYTTDLSGGDKLRTGTNDRHQQSLTFGLRHDFEPFIAVKYQAKYIYDLEGTSGLFNYYNSDPVTIDNAWVFDVSLQFVFGNKL